MKGNLAVVILCAVGIIILEAYAIHQKIDGVALSLAIIALAGLGGYKFEKIKDFFLKR